VAFRRDDGFDERPLSSRLCPECRKEPYDVRVVPIDDRMLLHMDDPIPFEFLCAAGHVWRVGAWDKLSPEAQAIRYVGVML